MTEIHSRCGLPIELCACQELDKEDTRIVIRLEMRRFKKPATMVEGLAPNSNLENMARSLKSRLACGGTTKEGYLLLQGDHRDAVKSHLVSLGFNESAIEVQ